MKANFLFAKAKSFFVFTNEADKWFPEGKVEEALEKVDEELGE